MIDRSRTAASEEPRPIVVWQELAGCVGGLITRRRYEPASGVIATRPNLRANVLKSPFHALFPKRVCRPAAADRACSSVKRGKRVGKRGYKRFTETGRVHSLVCSHHELFLRIVESEPDRSTIDPWRPCSRRRHYGDYLLDHFKVLFQEPSVAWSGAH